MQRIIGGKARHRNLKKIDEHLILRPTSDKARQALFNILQDRIIDATFLDLFAGTGAIGLEALSRGAKQCVFIENNFKHYNLIKENIESLGLCGGEIFLNDYTVALQILHKKQSKFDIIFLDPPYFQNFGNLTLTAISEYDLLNKDGLVIFEHQKKEKILEEIGKLHLSRQKGYGDTTIPFYSKCF